LGVGDLRPYLFVRFFPMLLMPLVFWLYPARTGPVDDGDILVVLGLYGLALVCGRVLDGPLFALGGIISGRQQFSFWAGPQGPLIPAGTAGIQPRGREPEPAKRPESGIHHADGGLL